MPPLFFLLGHEVYDEGHLPVLGKRSLVGELGGRCAIQAADVAGELAYRRLQA